MKNFIKNTPFLALFGTQFLGAFTDNFFRAALVTLITYHLENHSETTKSFFVFLSFALFTLPFFIFSPLAGQLADRYNQSRIIQWVKGSEILIVSLSSYGFFYKNFSFLLLGLFFMAIPSTFFGPAKYGLLPNILSQEDLLRGNGYIEAGSFLAITLGTFGGALMVQWKIPQAFLIFQLLFLSLMGFFLSLYLPSLPHKKNRFKLRFSWIAEIKHLISFVKNDKRVLKSLLCIAWFWLIENSILTQLPVFSTQILNAQETIFVFLLLLFTLGNGMGSIFCGWIFKGKIKTRYIPLFSLMMIILLLDIAAFRCPLSSHPISLIQFLSFAQGLRLIFDFFCVAFIGGIYIVLLYTFIQIHVSSEHRAQIISLSNILNAGFVVFGSFFSICLLGLEISCSTLLLLIAIGQVIITLYVIRSLIKK